MGEARSGGDVGDGYASVGKQCRGTVELTPEHVAVRRETHHAAELAREVGRAQAGFGREVGQCRRVVQVRLDASADAPQLDR